MCFSTIASVVAPDSGIDVSTSMGELYYVII